MTELQRPTLWDIFTSVVAAMFGVQSQRKREFDFNRGVFRDYAIVGLVLMVVFMAAVMAVVQLVMFFAVN